MRKLKVFFADYFFTFLIFLLIIAVYIIGTETGLLINYMFPRVSEIAVSYRENFPDMIKNMFASFGLLIPSISLGTLLGLLIGMPLGLSGKLRKIFHPVIYSVSVIPVILLSPFLLYLAPTLKSAAISLVLYNFLWAIIFSTINGVMTIEKSYLDKARNLQIKGFKKIVKVILPAATPTIVAGFISSLRTSFVVLVYAEMYGAKHGLGYFIKWHADIGQFEHVWSGFTFMSIVLVCVMLIVEKIKNRILRWAI